MWFFQFSEFLGYTGVSVILVNCLSVSFCHWSPQCKSVHKCTITYKCSPATTAIPEPQSLLKHDPCQGTPRSVWGHSPSVPHHSRSDHALPPTALRALTAHSRAVRAHGALTLPQPPQTAPLGTYSQLSAQKLSLWTADMWVPRDHPTPSPTGHQIQPRFNGNRSHWTGLPHPCQGRSVSPLPLWALPLLWGSAVSAPEA